MTSPAFAEASQATSALIWSIVGLACCLPAAIVGYIQARNELDAIAAGRRDPANHGTAKAAKVIAIVATVVFLLLGAFAYVTLLMFLNGLSGGAFVLVDGLRNT